MQQGRLQTFRNTLPFIERMNDIRKALQEDQKGQKQERLDRGELRTEVIRILPEGLGSYERNTLEHQAQEKQSQ